MHPLRSTLALGLLVSLHACTSASPGSAASDDAGSTDDAGLSSDEMATFGSGGDSLAAHLETATLANSLFDFDPTIDATSSPSVNATAIAQNIQSNLGTSCGTVSVSGTTVTVAFGAPPGCTLSNGPEVSGTVSVGVSQSGSTTSLALTLTDVVVDGEPLAGQTTFATTNGTTFQVTSTLTSGTKSDTANLTITGASGSFDVSGTAQVTENGASSDITFDDVDHVNGECYATSGTMTVTTGPTSETITFNANTPATGEVTLTIGKRSVPSTLPGYGSCPSDASDAGKRDGSSKG
jgi:hypothetical protein